MAQNENSVNAREFTRTASGNWVLDSMPAFNGVLQVTFREPYRLDSIPQSWQVLVGGVDKTADVTAYTAEEGPDTLGWLNILEGDTVMLVPPTAVKPTVKNVTLVDPSAPTELGHALADAVVGEIVGTDGKAYAVADMDNLPEGVTAAGVVAYKNGSNGMAIALTDEASTMNWSTANGTSGAAAHTPAVTGRTWKLPSQTDFENMCVYNEDEFKYYCSSLQSAITNAGGTALRTGNVDYYWTTTAYGSSYVAWKFDSTGTMSTTTFPGSKSRLVRAVLEF